MMVRTLAQEHGYAVRPACALLELATSSFYYQSQVADHQLEADLKKEAGQHPTYGTRRLLHQLRRKPYRYQVNRKHIQRLARRFGLLRPVKRRKVRTTDSQHPYPRYENLVKGLEVVRPDEVWVSDITYIRLQSDFVYLAIVLDVFTRAVRGWCLSRTIDQQLSLDALVMALQEHRHRSTTATRVCNMPARLMSSYSNSWACTSVWLRWVKPKRTATPNALCGPSKKRRSIYPNIVISRMPTSKLASSSRMCT
jgi:transposase InsO family protein